jgi:hypothetical protein
MVWINNFTCITDYRRGFGSVNRFTKYSLVVTTSNYTTFKITVIMTNKVFYICFNYPLLGNRTKQWLFFRKVFLSVSWQRILTQEL